MRRRCWLACVVLIAVGLFGAWSSSAQIRAGGPTFVRVKPADGNYRVGDQFDVEVWVEDVSSLYGADVQLSFDPTRLAVLDANASLPGVQVAPQPDLLVPDFVVRREADNVTGTVWYAATQLNPRPPASGSGPLFSFAFEVLARGTTMLVVQDCTLSTRDGEPISASATGAQFSLVGQDDIYLRLFLPLVMVSVH